MVVVVVVGGRTDGILGRAKRDDDTRVLLNEQLVKGEKVAEAARDTHFRLLVARQRRLGRHAVGHV